jgi:hypothetical protein
MCIRKIVLYMVFDIIKRMLKSMRKFKKVIVFFFVTDFLFDFWEKSNVFQPSFDDISAIC